MLPGVRRARLEGPPCDGVLLLYARHDSAFREMQPIARLVREQRRFLPVFLFATAEAEARVADCEAEGLGYLLLDPVPPQDSGVTDHGTLAGLRRLGQVRRRLRQDYGRLRALLEILDPFFLGVPGDRELGPGPPLLRAANDLDVPVMIVSPAFPSSDSEAKKRAEPRRFKLRLRDGAPLLNGYVGWRLPAQRRETAFGPRLFTPGWLTLALHREGMLSAAPWRQGGGPSQYLMVQGEEQAARFRAMGCPPEKLKVLGHMEHDLLHRAWCEREARRRELAARHGFDPASRLVVFAVPSYAEQGLMPMAEQLDALDGYGAALRESGAAVVLSLHPKSRAEDYRAFAERHGLKLEAERLFRLLPAADLFVSGGSTTIDWAILCGIPVIDTDIPGLDIDLWDKEPAVLRVKTLAAFDEALQRLLGEAGGLDELAAVQRQRSEQLARFDGRVAERFLDFLDELHAAHRARRPAAA